MNLVGIRWTTGGRTNNYAKVTQLVACTETDMLARAASMYFFFDDRDAESTKRALEMAEAAYRAVTSVVSDRLVRFSVYRKVGEYKMPLPIGESDTESAPAVEASG